MSREAEIIGFEDFQSGFGEQIKYWSIYFSKVWSGVLGCFFLVFAVDLFLWFESSSSLVVFNRVECFLVRPCQRVCFVVVNRCIFGWFEACFMVF